MINQVVPISLFVSNVIMNRLESNICFLNSFGNELIMENVLFCFVCELVVLDITEKGN